MEGSMRQRQKQSEHLKWSGEQRPVSPREKRGTEQRKWKPLETARNISKSPGPVVFPAPSKSKHQACKAALCLRKTVCWKGSKWGVLSRYGPRQTDLAPEITGTASNLSLSLTPGRLHFSLCPGLVPCDREGWTRISDVPANHRVSDCSQASGKLWDQGSW